MLLIVLIVASALFYKFGIPKIKKALFKKRIAKWNNTPKDLVILHGPPRARTVTHASPFFVKLETYLRMANIKYETDCSVKDAFGPKGKFPWITINGQHIGDTQLIQETLNKKFGVNLNGSYTPEELAKAAAVRIMLEEHFFWGMALYRFVFGEFTNFVSIMGASAPVWRLWVFKTFASIALPRRAKSQGIGLHSQHEVEQLTLDDLKNASILLGNKKFILGDEPCEHDSGIYGQLSQAAWGTPGSVYDRALNGELSNLKEYCIRMREKFYPDWNKLVDK